LRKVSFLFAMLGFDGFGKENTFRNKKEINLLSVYLIE
jgi:hypothetical protein